MSQSKRILIVGCCAPAIAMFDICKEVTVFDTEQPLPDGSEEFQWNIQQFGCEVVSYIRGYITAMIKWTLPILNRNLKIGFENLKVTHANY